MFPRFGDKDNKTGENTGLELFFFSVLDSLVVNR